jgi:hypothetical protein
VGAQGSTGAQGNQGQVGAQGSTGAQGNQGQVGVQGSTGAQGNQGSQVSTADTTFTGTTTINRLNVSEVSESITSVAMTNGTSASVSYTTSAVYYLSTTTPTGAITLTVTSLPSTIDATRIYTMNILYPTTSAGNYINSVIISSPAAGTGGTFAPKFPSTPSAAGTGNLVSQQLIFIYQASTFRILSSVINYSTA